MVSINAWKEGDLRSNFLLGTLRAGYALWRPARTDNPFSFMVPYGQATHSPDHERHLTFRSQKIQETGGNKN